jgi:hypothetical protein
MNRSKRSTWTDIIRLRKSVLSNQAIYLSVGDPPAKLNHSPRMPVYKEEPVSASPPAGSQYPQMCLERLEMGRKTHFHRK